jgi:hypothetical protein
VTVDDFLPAAWPAPLVAALDNWRQGDLIKGGQVAWLSPAGQRDDVVGEDVPGKKGDLSPLTNVISDTGYLAITSQTCDIAIAGPGQRHPFVQVSPIRDVGAAFGSDKVRLIKEGRVVEYVYLTNPPVAGADWAVDLRMSMAMSKAALAESAPIRAFLTDEDELVFSERVASKIRRPALHDALANDLIQSLTELIERHRHKESWCAELEQLRLDIVGGSRLHPERVRLVAVTEVKFDPAMCKPLREEWKSLKKSFKKQGIEQAQMVFHTVEAMKVDLYRRSVPLNLPGLGRGNFV